MIQYPIISFMNLLKRLLTAFALLTLFIFLQCHKDYNPPIDNPYGLPNATQSGANIFACRVNGVNWISKTDIYNLGGGVSNDTLSGHGTVLGNNYFDMIEFTIQGGAMAGGHYTFNSTSGQKINFQTNKTCNGYLGNNIQHLVSTSGLGIITKIDKLNKIISGTFNCKVPVATCDTLNITDGRFDINYY